MNVISVYINPTDGQVLQVLASNDIGSPGAGLELASRFDGSAYPLHYNRLSSLSKFIRLIDGALVLQDPVLGTSVVADAAWIAARQAEVEAAEAEKTDDTTARTDLLAQAAAALTQLENDLTAIANGKTAANAATTLAQFRTIILGMLDVQEHTCTRQRGVIKTLRAGLRNGWG